MIGTHLAWTSFLTPFSSSALLIQLFVVQLLAYLANLPHTIRSTITLRAHPVSPLSDAASDVYVITGPLWLPTQQQPLEDVQAGGSGGAGKGKGGKWTLSHDWIGTSRATGERAGGRRQGAEGVRGGGRELRARGREQRGIR